MAQSSIFPIFLRAEYREDANGVPKFISRIQQAAKISEAEMRKVGTALNSALSAPRTGSGSLDLGTAQLREYIKQQEMAAAAAREIQQATLAAANATGTFNAALTPTINAYRDFAKAKDADVAASRAQLAALQAVEAELEKGTRAVQARLQAEQSLANFRKTVNLNEGALRAAAGQASIDRAALSGATLESVLGRTRTANPAVAQQRAQEAAEMQKVAAAAAKQAAAMADLSRAEAGAAAGAQLLQAIYRGTAAELTGLTLETARATKSARESAQAFEQAFAAQEAQAERTAAALREQAAAVAALRAQINPAAAAQEQFNQKVAFAKAALDRGELSQKEYARAVQLASAELREAGRAEIAAAAARNGLTAATRQGTTARRNVINSIGSERTAFIQLGQQLQDMTVQAQMGTNAFIIMGQQLPQAAFALSGLEGSANKTKAAIGRIATFLSGPWGAAIFVGLAVLGPLVQKLFESEDAADASSRAQRSLSEVLRDSKSSYEEVTQALNEYNRAQERSREVTILTIQAQAEAIAQNLREAISIREKTKARIAELQAADANLRRTGDRGAFGFGAAADDLAPLLADQDAQIAKLMQGAANVRVQAATEIARIQSDAGARITAGFDVLRENAKRTITDVNQLADRLTQLNRDEQAALNASRRSGGASGGSSARRSGRASEVEQLARFGEQAAETIQRINERFDEQPRLIDAAAQATRQLDAIIAELEKRKPLNFEQAVQDAEAAKRTIEDALVRPFELLRQESQQRIEIERALAEGRVDEAAALQEIFRIEQALGPIGKERRDEIREIVALEREKITYLRDQQAIFQAQLDVVQTVRRDLTDLLSGRSTDFFKNFRQALQDLQGQRLFEAIFGDAFRQIEQELQRSTPQGRANAAYTEQVNKTADTTSRLEDSLSSLADAATEANDRIMAAYNPRFASRIAANDTTGVAGNLFGATGIGGIAAAALGARGITVSGNRIRETDISRQSTADLAERISRGIGESIGAELESVFGPRFATMFGDIIGGIIAGKVQGGNVAAVLGGLQKLTGNIRGLEGISATLGDAGRGAALGTQVAGISNLLGLGGSTTGAQIGGAIGGALGSIIPGGSIIGAIAGNIIGGLLKKTPRASATIGGIGGSLGLTSVTGTSSSLRDAASGLGGSVLEAVNRIAEQLGASVNAGAGSVSIGQRRGNIRVDPRGRGVTRIDNGAIDFGDDAEAAIAFAVRDLIQDGVITGLRQSEQNLLRAGNDIEAALQDVLTFRGVFDRLEDIRDPVGGAIRRLNTEFEGLIDLFERAGASTEEFADLEELYNIERARAIEEASDRVIGSLRQLLNDLTIGDSGLSLRSRRSTAAEQFDALAARVAAGDSTAFDDFADIAQQLLDIERQLFGSTQSYFDRLAQVTALTEQAIADQTNVTSIATGAPSPFDERASVTRAIEASSAEQVGWLRAINDNLIALNPASRPAPVAVGGGFGGNPFPSLIQNF